MKGVGLFRVVGAFSRGEGGGVGVRSWGRRGVVGWIMGVIWGVKEVGFWGLKWGSEWV